MSATENMIVDCLASNPGSKDFTSYQHVIQLLSECYDRNDDGDGGGDDGDGDDDGGDCDDDGGDDDDVGGDSDVVHTQH